MTSTEDGRPTTDDCRAEYERRLSEWRARIAVLDRRHHLYSNARLILAVAGALLLWQAFVRARISPWWPIADLLLFAVLAVAHAFLLQRAERSRRAEAVYLRGLDRLADRWAGTGRDGARFLEGHSYARDLDLFGRGSLFERLNTARTEAGELTLAEWIRAGAPADEVRARQASVAELRARLDFREDVAVLASESPVGRTGALATWAASPPAKFPDALRVGLAAAAAVTVALTWLTYREAVWSGWFVFWVLIETGVAAIWRHEIHHVLHAIETPERDLGLLSALLARIEREPFASPRLNGLRDTLLAGGVPPSRRIARLRSLVSWADSTHNLLFGPIAHILLVKPQIAVAIDRWQRANGRAIGDWLRVVGDVEALSALATYTFERPADPFPEIVDGRAALRRRSGRPSAAPRRRVGAERRAARRQPSARDRGQRIEYVGQEHAAADGRRQRGAVARRRSGARRRSCASRRSSSAPRCASRTRCRRGTRASTPKSCGSITSSRTRAGRCRCCSCSTRFFTDQFPRPADRRGSGGARTGRARRYRAGDDARPGADRTAEPSPRRRQHAFRRSAGKRPDGVRLSHSQRRGRAQQRDRAHAGDRARRVMGCVLAETAGHAGKAFARHHAPARPHR
jgi:hypothetical protein